MADENEIEITILTEKVAELTVGDLELLADPAGRIHEWIDMMQACVKENIRKMPVRALRVIGQAINEEISEQSAPKN